MSSDTEKKPAAHSQPKFEVRTKAVISEGLTVDSNINLVPGDVIVIKPGQALSVRSTRSLWLLSELHKTRPASEEGGLVDRLTV